MSIQVCLLRAVVVMMAGGLGVAQLVPEPAGSAEWPVTQWNMEATTNPTDYQASIDVALFLVHQASPRPWAVVRNEVCHGQYAAMKNNYGPMGYATTTINWVAIKASSSACPGGEAIGNVVFMRGGSPSHAVVPHTQAGVDPHHRWGICNRTVTFLGPMAACSDHFTPSNVAPHVTVAQANELLFAASSLYPGITKWALGDFNLRPPGAGGTPVPAGWYTNFREADPTESATRDTGVKNDFIFGAKNVFGSFRYASILNVGYSDHYYFTGTFST